MLKGCNAAITDQLPYILKPGKVLCCNDEMHCCSKTNTDDTCYKFIRIMQILVILNQLMNIFLNTFDFPG